MEFVRRPCIVGAGVNALQLMDSPVTFRDSPRIKARFLKLAVHVAREHKRTVLHPPSPLEQNAKSRVRLGCTVKRETMTVKAPAQARIGREAGRVGDVLEGKSMVT
jgi:hypothetical protein